MLKYLEDALSERSHKAAFAYQREPESVLMETQHLEIYKAFKETLQAHQHELYNKISNINSEMSVKDRTACYRAGWLDGITLGVMAATRGDHYQK
jgi:hypothetical protein